MYLWDAAQDSAVLQHSTIKAQNRESKLNKGSYRRNFRPLSLNIPSESNSLLFSQELTSGLGLCFEFK